MRRLCLGVTKDRVSVGVDDYRGVRTMSGQRHAESAGVGGKRRRFTIASERMKDDDRFALQALSLVGGADEYAGQIGQASCKRRAESWPWWATGLTMPRHWLRPTWASPSALARMSPTSASDITLVGSDLRSIVSAIALSRHTVATIKQRLFWAFVYNVVIIPVAMGALYPFTGALLDPVLGRGGDGYEQRERGDQCAALARVQVAGFGAASRGDYRSRDGAASWAK